MSEGILVNRNVVVIGGSSGLGKVISQMYAAQGWQVAIVSRSRPSFIDRATNVMHFSADLAVLNLECAKSLVDKISAEIGMVSYLIFCQRYRGNDKSLASEINVSLSATSMLIDAFSEKFTSEGDRAVGIISSVYGEYVGSSQSLDYHMVKAGLNALVRYYAVNLGAKGIRVNAISPLTYLKEESKHVYLNDETKLAKYRKLVPLKRMGTAEECANVIYFLCNEKSSFVTGQNIFVDGGVSVIWPEELV